MSEEAPVVDAEVVEHAESAGTDVAVRPPSREVLAPMDADKVIQGMRDYQALLRDLLDESDWQSTRDGRFPKKSAWRKIARAFNLSVEIVSGSLRVDRDEEGQPVRAECVARAIAPNGQVSDADGYCSISEFTGKRANDPKLENTLRATATTRAKNRAIADLVGMGEVSAEEVTVAQGPTYGPAVTKEDAGAASAALTYLCDGDTDTAQGVWSQITAAHEDYMPAAVAQGFRLAARAVKQVRDAEGVE